MKAVARKYKPDKFLELSRTVPVIDVRSPKEFSHGHIPGAINIPLFNDEERAEVGTTYTRKGPEQAMFMGLEFVGPKMASFVRQAKALATSNELLVHCWRGGMRSAAMAWLFNFSGIKADILEGGYKAYRKFIRQSFLSGPELIVLGGMTGSGKTEALHYLAGQGQQIIDLEALANHKGSAFGSLGQPGQPTNEQFENNLAHEWLSLNPEKPVWIEDESRNVGKVIIPDELFNKMIGAKAIVLDVPFGERVERLFEEYGNFDIEKLSETVSKISRRIGGDIANEALRNLASGNTKEAVAIVLKYYDKTYKFGLSIKDKSRIKTVSITEFRRGYAEFHRD